MLNARQGVFERRKTDITHAAILVIAAAVFWALGTAVPALAQSTTAPLGPAPTPVYAQPQPVPPAVWSDGEAIRQVLEYERDGLLRSLPSGRSIVITGSGSDGRGPCRSFMVMEPAGYAETAVACRDTQARWMLVEVQGVSAQPAQPAPAAQGSGFAVPPLAISLPALQPAPGHGLAMPQISPEAAAIAASVGLLAILAATGAEIGYCPP